MTRVISYGGGVQSTALVVLAATGRLDEIMGGPVDAALFCNVGDDSEHPATLRFVREYAIPWATERGFTIHELHKVNRRGVNKGPETLYGRLTREGSRSIDIPIRMDNGMFGRRKCTADFKIALMQRWLREHGATPDAPATVAVGFSTDEIERVGRRRQADYERVVYPLLDLGLNRDRCMTVIRDAGLPVPPKSACWFCPFHKPSTWAEMRRDEPDLFWKSVDLEALLNKRRADLGRDPVWLTRFNKPLDEAIGEAQPTLWGGGIGEDGCDEGVCFV